MSPRGRRNPDDPLIFWHGARAWGGAPAVRGARKGRAEHGPGIYLTTSRETAQRYSKGGGVVMRVEVAPSLRWLELATLPLDESLAFVAAVPRLGSRRARLLADLHRLAARDVARGGVAASALVNLMVNAGASDGAAAAA